MSKLLSKCYHPVETLDWLLILYLQPIKKVVSVENDAGSYHIVPYVFLRARIVYACSARFCLRPAFLYLGVAKVFSGGS